MKYGIDQNGYVIKCANCKKIVASDGELKQSYCDECGAPLSINAIARYEINLEDTQKDLIDHMQEIAKKNNTDSFSKILKILKED